VAAVPVAPAFEAGAAEAGCVLMIPEIGVIAQEIELVVPEVVEEVGEYKAVAYGNLVALLIEAIKELDRKVDARTCN
jgi:hypothetical protein